MVKKKWIICSLLVLTFLSCDGQRVKNPEILKALAGSWKARHISNLNRPNSLLTLFTVRPDSSLALSLELETAPRSRVWTFDSDVLIEGAEIRWGDYKGLLNMGRDTISATKEEPGGPTSWLFVRDTSADSLMKGLYSLKADSYVYELPENLNDGWSCSDMTAVGIAQERIVDLIREISRGKHDDIHSLLIVKDDKLVVEEYFAANGSKHGPFITRLFRDKVHHLASTTKCVTSTLVGIAIDQGFIKDVTDPIYRYLPPYDSLFSDQKKRIRICDMLTMTPGFEWRQFGVSDDKNDGMQMWHTRDVIRYVLEKPLEAEPGRKYNYSNGVPTVTGAIIKNAVGMEVASFAEEYLFKPLGISDYAWTSYPDGSVETDGGLALRSRDLAKLGELFLNGGLWNNQRIVSEQWVRESTEERLKFGKFNRWGYGYHWMQAESRIGDRVLHSYFVPGDGNQIVVVFPEVRMVIVCTAGNYGRDPKSDYYSLLDEYILPAIMPQR
jgi:CubicO group peptidase (beta-lactamase class C family)